MAKGHTTLGCDGPGMSVFLMGLFTGTFSSITIKVAYQMTSVGADGTRKPFEKPLTTTFLMFMAMAMALPAMRVYARLYPPSPSDEPKPLNWRLCLLVLAPSLFDLVGTAFAKAFVLKDHLAPHMWLGVSINLVAMVLVASTTFFDHKNTVDNRDPRVGIGFILLSCLVQGTQYVFEEKVMTVESLPPMVLVGLEGFWGMILMLLVVFPSAYYLPGTDEGGSMENVFDSLAMVRNSAPLQAVLLIFFLTVACYNIFAIYVTHFLSSVWHAILDNFRPISVWGTDLLIYYVFTYGRFGEAWTVYSWLQFGGMLLLFFGTAVYNGSVPWLLFPSYAGYERVEAGTEEGKGDARIRAQSIEDFAPVIRTDRSMIMLRVDWHPPIKGVQEDGGI
ncbi:drug metabolite transporter superfamily [Nannochloropsis gaditana CCMP526]|uniref:drug metabolite transporter superfamily n=1 Tax=Nannochloropsis gaditana (strain CCMP526) TaxID=1093141 RepID=UPI00029F53DD|nr:drug metabolite transporter superfamily [Nannochloropsis gaditana CCMP526]EKU22662.1 drug metabolite transporter superfamily [Nannochloropsis gaditana CCMP526]|eukprot:XP_005853698.1 drug metabolite transporter superfamily [Nannochloropsis gaditana CCMP526]